MELEKAIKYVLDDVHCGAMSIHTKEAYQTVVDYLETLQKSFKNQRLHKCEECEDFEIQLTGPYCKNWKTFVDGKGCFYGRKICTSK